MGRIAEQLYKVGALTTGLYGTTQGWQMRINDGINKMTNGSLDNLVHNAATFIQPMVELAPYALTLYAAMELGGRALAKRKLTVQ